MSITSSQVAKIDKEITPPVAGAAKKKEDKNMTNEAIVNVRWNNSRQQAIVMYQDKQFNSMDELSDILRGYKQKMPTYRVIIRGDKALPAVEIQKVMAMVAQAEIDDISFSALNQ
jgi:biopolymer transport protein ExbD